MRKQITILLVTCAWLLLSGMTLTRSAAGFDLWWHAVAGGGGRSASASYAVGGSLGQPAAGVLSSAGFRLSAGFWPGVLEPLPTGTPTPSATPSLTPTPTPTSTPTTTPTGTVSPRGRTVPARKQGSFP